MRPSISRPRLARCSPTIRRRCCPDAHLRSPVRFLAARPQTRSTKIADRARPGLLRRVNGAEIDGVHGLGAGRHWRELQVQYHRPVVQSMRQRQYIMDKHGMVDARDLQNDVAAQGSRAPRPSRAELKAFNDKIPEAVRRSGRRWCRTRPDGRPRAA